MMNVKRKIVWIEPLFFIFFGLLHLHRIWAFIDRGAYAGFWLAAMNGRNWFYFTLMGTMALLCIIGMVLFTRNRGREYWWRWVYIFGGAYVLFDLFAILIGLQFWSELLHWMFDTENAAWNMLWGFFILIGAASFTIGVWLVRKFIKNPITQELGKKIL